MGLNSGRIPGHNKAAWQVARRLLCLTFLFLFLPPNQPANAQAATSPLQLPEIGGARQVMRLGEKFPAPPTDPDLGRVKVGSSNTISGPNYWICTSGGDCDLIFKEHFFWQGGVSGPFQLGGNCQNFTFYLTGQRSNSCNFAVTFRPVLQGAASANLCETLTWVNAPGGPISDTGCGWVFTGTGFSPNKNNCSITASSSINASTLALSESVPLVGVPFSLDYSSDLFQPGFQFTIMSIGLGGWSPSILHHYDTINQMIYSGDGTSRSVQASGMAGGFYVSNQSAHSIYYFDSNGNQIATKDALTGVTTNTFSYNESGQLVAIVDQFGNQTNFQYSDNQVLMTSPYGQETQMLIGSDGFLESVTNPNSETYNMRYDGNGDLTSFQKPMGQTSNATYDSDGHVIKDQGAGGNSISLVNIFNPTTQLQTVTSSTALNRQTVYQSITSQTGTSETVTSPTGEITSSNTPYLGVGSSTDSVGTSTMSNLVPDPRFGTMSPYDQDFTYSVSNSNIDVSTHKNIQATLAKSGDPLSLKFLTTTTELQNDPSRTSTKTYTATTRTITDVSPLNRTTTTVLNPQGEVQSTQVGNLTPTSFSYDNRGRLISLSLGSNRNMTFTYDNLGNTRSITNFLGQTTQFDHDLAGRVIKQNEPDGSTIQFGYDKNGNLTSITPPSRPAHIFSYNLFDLVASYLPPSLGGLDFTTTYRYNADRQLTEVDLPTGEKIIYNYDSSTGLLTSINTPSGDYNYTYEPNTSLTSQLTSPDGETLNYQYAGPFVTNISTQGAVTSGMSKAYNPDATVASTTPSGASSSGFTEPIIYDKDGLVVGVGDLSMKRDQNGRVTNTNLININETLGYNSFGEMTSDQFTYTSLLDSNGSDYDHDQWRDNHKPIYLFNAKYQRDKLGRVVIVEDGRDIVSRFGQGDPRYSDHGFGDSTQYIYDNLGRLTEVLKDRHIEREYKYDGNGNRIEMIEEGRITRAKYDAQDRLIRYGNIEYKYDNNGMLTEKIVHTSDHGRAHAFFNWLLGHFDDDDRDDTQALITKYNFDVFGNLKSVTLPDGRVVSYIYDGQNRLVGKKINDQLVEEFVYQSQTQVAAELDGQGHTLWNNLSMAQNQTSRII